MRRLGRFVVEGRSERLLFGPQAVNGDKVRGETFDQRIHMEPSRGDQYMSGWLFGNGQNRLDHTALFRVRASRNYLRFVWLLVSPIRPSGFQSRISGNLKPTLAYVKSSTAKRQNKISVELEKD